MVALNFSSKVMSIPLHRSPSLLLLLLQHNWHNQSITSDAYLIDPMMEMQKGIHFKTTCNQCIVRYCEQPIQPVNVYEHDHFSYLLSGIDASSEHCSGYCCTYTLTQYRFVSFRFVLLLRCLTMQTN